MWQRIQSVYLFVTAILFVVVFFQPVADLSQGTSALNLDYKGVLAIGAWTITAINLVVPLLSIIIFFFYKKRFLQIRLCIVNLVLMLGYYPLLFIYIYNAVKNGYAYNLQLSVVFPLVGAILTYLALRAIGRDEAMVRSLNRVR